MATRIYDSKNIVLMDGTELEIVPLKIKYLREFMDVFNLIQHSTSDEEAVSMLVECTRITMKQFCPEISDSVESVEDVLDMPTIYSILEVAAGIKINKSSEESVKSQAIDSGPSWSELDLAKVESEVFLLGIWKDYQELERSLSMPEIMATLATRRELDYEEKKFLAAIQGVDLEDNNEDSGEVRGQKEWEDMKARVFSRGATSDANDVLALQGINAKKAGFGIGFGLDYEDSRDPSVML